MNEESYSRKEFEAVAEWLKKTIDVDIETSNFMNVLRNGVVLCFLVEKVHESYRKLREADEPCTVTLSPMPKKYHKRDQADKRPSFARDNVAAFLTLCRELGVGEDVRFEANDLVSPSRGSERRAVVQTLFDFSLLAAKCGLDSPNLDRFDEEEEDEVEETPIGDVKEGEVAPPVDVKEGEIAPLVHKESTLPVSPSGNAKRRDSKVKPKSKKSAPTPVKVDVAVRGVVKAVGYEHSVVKDKEKGEGYYVIQPGDKRAFVRVLRSCIMVKVGGGWSPLETYLLKRKRTAVKISDIDSREPISTATGGEIVQSEKEKQGGVSEEKVAQTQTSTPRRSPRIPSKPLASALLKKGAVGSAKRSKISQFDSSTSSSSPKGNSSPRERRGVKRRAPERNETKNQPAKRKTRSEQKKNA